MPYVSSVVVDGDTVTIEGSGFGTKETVAPTIFDNCESGVITDKWTEIYPYLAGASYNMQYRTGTYRNVTQPHSNSTKFAVGGHDPDGYALSNWDNRKGPNVILGKFTGYSDKIFASYYMHIDPLWSATQNDNFKLWRFVKDSFIESVAGGFYTQYVNDINFTTNDGVYSVNFFGSPYYSEVIITDPRTNWIKVEIELYNNATNGTLKLWEDGVLKIDFTGDTKTTGDRESNSFAFGSYYRKTSEDDSDENAFRYFDDLYVDTFWQRVVVGDNIIYADCTNREIQIPTAWSSTDITATYNQGSFANDDPMYLFVIDSEGNVSDGVLIGDAEPPTATGVSVSGTGTITGGGTIE
jgi:hypothetical protein